MMRRIKASFQGFFGAEPKALSKAEVRLRMTKFIFDRTPPSPPLLIFNHFANTMILLTQIQSSCISHVFTHQTYTYTRPLPHPGGVYV
jgi:hypothetical protein